MTRKILANKPLVEATETINKTCSLAQRVPDREIPAQMLEIDIVVDMQPKKRYSLPAEVVTRRKAEPPLVHLDWIEF